LGGEPGGGKNESKSGGEEQAEVHAESDAEGGVEISRCDPNSGEMRRCLGESKRARVEK
jgi:hypothetical protein